MGPPHPVLLSRRLKSEGLHGFHGAITPLLSLFTLAAEFFPFWPVETCSSWLLGQLCHDLSFLDFSTSSCSRLLRLFPVLAMESTSSLQGPWFCLVKMVFGSQSRGRNVLPAVEMNWCLSSAARARADRGVDACACAQAFIPVLLFYF